jgi:hypothetical protein
VPRASLTSRLKGWFRRSPSLGNGATTSSMPKPNFPWRVGANDKNGRPRVLDSKHAVVCEVLTPDHGVAEYIVERCNDYRYMTVSNAKA